jgi:hypothetical protein
MKDVILFAKVEGGGLLAAIKGGWADLIMHSGL